MAQPTLTGNAVRLRALKRNDIRSIATQANSRSVARFIPPIHHPYTADHARKWVNRTNRTFRNKTACQFGIERINHSGIIGMIGLNNLNWSDRNAELEYWLGRRFRGKGYASEALRLVLSYAFEDLRFRRVYAITIEINKPSVALLEKHGFVREATWRQASRMNRKWHDVYGYGLLKEEYR